jgi:transposase
MHGRRVGILLTRKRHKCRSCGITFLPRCDDINDRHRATNRLVSYVESHGMVRTFTSIADEVGIAESTVMKIVSGIIGRLELKYRFETPEIVGIDEVHLNRQMRLVLTNIGERTIIDLVLVASRKKQSVISALYRFKSPKQIKYVTMDMWRPYRDAVNAVLPHAIIVIDKFHVVKMANEAVEKGCKDLRGQMTSGEVKLLKKDRFVIWMHQKNSCCQDGRKIILFSMTYTMKRSGFIPSGAKVRFGKASYPEKTRKPPTTTGSHPSQPTFPLIFPTLSER